MKHCAISSMNRMALLCVQCPDSEIVHDPRVSLKILSPGHPTSVITFALLLSQRVVMPGC